MVMVPKTDTTPYKGHVRLYTCGFAAALLLLIVATVQATNGSVAGWDSGMLKTINALPDQWYRGMVAITWFGSAGAVLAMVIAALLTRYFRLAWRVAISAGSAAVIAEVMKRLVDRPRPAGVITDVNVRVHEVGMGFPSIHTAVITVLALTLLPYVPWRWRWLVPVAIVAVAVSRIYLGVHSPLDIVGGIALGTAIVAFVRIMPQALRVLLKID